MVMADVGIAYIVTAYTVMAYIVMAYIRPKAPQPYRQQQVASVRVTTHVAASCGFMDMVLYSYGYI